MLALKLHLTTGLIHIFQVFLYPELDADTQVCDLSEQNRQELVDALDLLINVKENLTRRREKGEK